jgi:hypothetical protein
LSGGVSYGDLKKILGYEIGVAVTGSESIPTTLVVTEGFGALSMSKRTFDLIQGFAGKCASLNGATQIRAGVIRPELIVPLSGKSEEENRKGGPSQSASLQIGALVRVIRAPRFGTLGTVQALPQERRRMESETLIRTVVIRSEEGEEIELPRANVEIIDA